MALTFAAASCAADGAPTSDTDQALIDAPLDDKNRTFAVGVCTGALNTDPQVGPVGTCRRGTARCSGTLVAPNLVLTARHCVRQNTAPSEAVPASCNFVFTDEPTASGGTRVTTAPAVGLGTPKWYDVDEIVLPHTPRGCEDDVALLILKNNIPRSEAFPVDPDFTDVGNHPPREVAIAGRGVTALTYALDANGDWTGGVASATTGDFQRRVSQRIAVLCASNGAPCSTLSHEITAPRMFMLPDSWFLIGTAAGPGDSGAGVFDQRGFTSFGGRWPRLKGVMVWAFIGPDGKVKDGGVLRVDRLEGWLKDTAWRAARKGRYLLPRWAESGDVGGP